MLPQFFPSAAETGVSDPGYSRNLQAADFAGDTSPATETGVTDSGYSVSDCGGILHFSNAGKCSWQEYAQWALDCCQHAGIALKARTAGPLKLSDMKSWAARRPVYSVLSTAKYTGLIGAPPRTWREAVADYITRFYSKK